MRTGERQAGKVYSTQAEALRAAEETARAAGGQIQLRGSNGEVRTRFTLGRTTMEKLNAVEGVGLTPAGRSAFKSFDRNGLSPSARRTALRKDVTKLAGPAATKKGSSEGQSRSPKG